ncbi:MAG: tripartite tricarboxylate transporter substrate binding protein [Synergistaceae bacterium]|nr:tripartite tricarboxylate transporter substrate binding protein [Synergistaceae bacterium]
MRKVFAFALVIIMALAGASFAADWPTKTVNVVLPYGAGGDTDTYCRQLFQRVSKVMGQTFVVINQQGGSGIVAAMNVINKPADGYTILFNHTGAALVQEATGTVDFSYTTDFANCCTVAVDNTYALVAISPEGEFKSYSKGWKTLADMIDYAKKNPGKVRNSTVFGSVTDFVGMTLESQAGVQFDNINIGTSGGERMAAMLGGQCDILAANYMQVKDYIAKGDLICLGIMAKERVPGIDYPTFTEQGYDKVIVSKKYEVKFPKGTPKEIVDKLASVCKEIVLNDPTYAEVLGVYFAQPFYRDAEQMNREDPEEVKQLEAGLAIDD